MESAPPLFLLAQILRLAKYFLPHFFPYFLVHRRPKENGFCAVLAYQPWDVNELWCIESLFVPLQVPVSERGADDAVARAVAESQTTGGVT